MYEMFRWRRPIWVLIDPMYQLATPKMGTLRREDETCIYVSNLHEVSYIAKTLQGMRALQGLAVEAAMHITQTFTVLQI